MSLRLRTVVAALFVMLWMGGRGAAPLAGRHQDSEEELRARIEHEPNAVKKAKLEVRLGRLMLRQAIGACEKDDHEHCDQFLQAYLGLIKSAWTRLQSTGRRAEKQPQGFKELDIALREDGRALDDLKRRVPYQDREGIDKVTQETDRIRSEVLKALFPAGRPHEEANNPAHQAFQSSREVVVR